MSNISGQVLIKMSNQTLTSGFKLISEVHGATKLILSAIISMLLLSSKNLKRTGKAGIFSASLELSKEGNITIKQNNLFDNIFIKEK